MVVEVDPRPLARLGKEKSSTDASGKRAVRSPGPKQARPCSPVRLVPGLRNMRLPSWRCPARTFRPTFSLRTRAPNPIQRPSPIRRLVGQTVSRRPSMPVRPAQRHRRHRQPPPGARIDRQTATGQRPAAPYPPHPRPRRGWMEPVDRKGAPALLGGARRHARRVRSKRAPAAGVGACSREMENIPHSLSLPRAAPGYVQPRNDAATCAPRAHRRRERACPRGRARRVIMRPDARRRRAVVRAWTVTFSRSALRHRHPALLCCCSLSLDRLCVRCLFRSTTSSTSSCSSSTTS